MAAPVKVGIIGYGLSAKVFHIPLIEALPDQYHLGAIVQRNPSDQSDCRVDHPNAKHYNSATDLHADPEISLIIVTTTPSSHFELAQDALKAGKNVVVEKPFTPTSAEADVLVSLAAEKNLVLTVYQNRRWDADFLLVKGFVANKELTGRIVEVESHFDRHRPNPPADTWKTTPAPGNGTIYDLGAHLIDQSLQLFGIPRKVTGFIYSQRKGQPEPADFFTVLLHYDDALTVTLKAGVISCEEEQLRFQIKSEKASLWIGGTDVQEEQLRAGITPKMSDFAVGHQSCWITTEKSVQDAYVIRKKREVFGNGQDYREFYRGLWRALAEKSEPPVEATEARQVIRIIELAMQSSKEERTLKVD